MIHTHVHCVKCNIMQDNDRTPWIISYFIIIQVPIKGIHGFILPRLKNYVFFIFYIVFIMVLFYQDRIMMHFDIKKYE